MSHLFCFVWGAYLAWSCSTIFLFAAEPVTDKTGASRTDIPNASPAGPTWLGDYTEAWGIAEREGKMLAVLFCRTGKCRLQEKFERETLADPEVRKRLSGMVRVRLPLDASATIDGRQVQLLKHPAFEEMLGLPGLAIVDLAHKKAKHYGQVVSVFPLLDERAYTVEQMKVILELPSGSLTQRTLIYAVRTHPDHPKSTSGTLDRRLVEEAESHSQYQASIRLQGHHFWESRFPRINRLLPSGCLASEVCAESWPGQRLLAAAIECVRCWRLSSGHWGAVSERHPVYGYDMKHGDNDVWYATGIFGRR